MDPTFPLIGYRNNKVRLGIAGMNSTLNAALFKKSEDHPDESKNYNSLVTGAAHMIKR